MILTTIPTMAAGGLTAFDATLVSTSIVLVFSLLVVLCLIIMLLGKFFDWVQKKANAAALDELNAPAPPASPAPAAPPAAKPAPAVEAGIPGEVVAAIAAAVCCLEDGAAIQSVRRLPRASALRRDAWSQAGLAQNTRPFTF